MLDIMQWYGTIAPSLPLLVRGAVVTVEIAFLGSLIGFSLGTLLGVLQSRGTWVATVISVYTMLVRGTPMLIQILFMYYGLPQIGLPIPAFWGAIVAIGLNSSAYICNIVRSGISSIHKGQVEAAYVLGFSNVQIMRYIVLPQALRVVLPALGNEFITLIKDSSLASVVGVAELTYEGRIIISTTADALTVYALVAFFYLCLTGVSSLGLHQLEKRINHA